MKTEMESRKVIILASTLVTGGAEMVMRSIAENLGDAGFGVELLLLREPGTVGSKLIDEGIEYKAEIARSRFDPVALFRLTALLRKRKNSVLLSLDHHNAVLWGSIAGRLAGLKGSVLSVHSTGLWGSGRTFNRLDRAVLPIYDRIVALSRGHAEHLAEHESVPEEKIVVINNGIDTERFAPPERGVSRKRIREETGIGVDDTVVTIVAALRPEKNHLLLLEAAGKVISENKKVRFLIVGEGEMRDQLVEAAAVAGISENVIFTGTRDDIPDILASTDISVLCSHPVVETFPLNVLEAMACGLPVISTDVGSISEMITDGVDGLLIPPGDSDALAAKILMLASDREERERIGGRARRKVVEEFSLKSMLRKYFSLLENLFADDS